MTVNNNKAKTGLVINTWIVAEENKLHNPECELLMAICKMNYS